MKTILLKKRGSTQLTATGVGVELVGSELLHVPL